MTARRRSVLRALAAAGGLGLAGCSSDGSSGTDESGGQDNTDEPDGSDSTDESGGSDNTGNSGDNWPPSRRLVDTLVSGNPGSSFDVQARLWMTEAEEYYPGDITSTVTGRAEAQGLVLLNEIANSAEPDGGTLGLVRANSAAVMQVGHSEANYDIRELRGVARYMADTRALQLNPRTTPVEDHFEFEWSDFQDLAEEQTLRFPYSNSAQLIFANLIRTWDPVLNEDNWQFVSVESGSNARAAVQRGDLDGYFGSYVSNISTRNDSYYTQFCMVDPENDPEFYDSIKGVLPETSPTATREEKTLENYEDQAVIVNVDNFPTEEARKVTQVVQDNMVQFLPPDTPDEIYQIHADALQQTVEESELEAKITDAFAATDYNPLTGEPVDELMADTYSTFAEDDTIRQQIEDNMEF